VLAEADGRKPHVVLAATGSEVALAVAARAILAGRGVPCRVVSIPCLERFGAQAEPYRHAVLPPGARTVVVEAARTDLWAATVGSDALRLGVSRFGASAPAPVLAEKFGFTPDAVADRITAWLRSS
ncbi:MAG TPA: transketolase C-terminal domain-containing protein, partial [Candidatus Eisenbacteria bacterium]|nr:transketolase C-terminal domain-containing protein [Candidatus Eisenbacteria bacterium]